MTHDFSGSSLTKTVRLRYHGKKPKIDIVEPIVKLEGMQFVRLDDRRMNIQGPRRSFRLEIIEGPATLDADPAPALYWNVYPAVRCFPVVLHIAGTEGAIRDTVAYRITLVR